MIDRQAHRSSRFTPSSRKESINRSTGKGKRWLPVCLPIYLASYLSICLSVVINYISYSDQWRTLNASCVFRRQKNDSRVFSVLLSFAMKTNTFNLRLPLLLSCIHLQRLSLLFDFQLRSNERKRSSCLVTGQMWSLPRRSETHTSKNNKKKSRFALLLLCIPKRYSISRWSEWIAWGAQSDI